MSKSNKEDGFRSRKQALAENGLLGMDRALSLALIGSASAENAD
jgi:hypothetical protein